MAKQEMNNGWLLVAMAISAIFFASGNGALVAAFGLVVLVLLVMWSNVR